MARRLTGNHPGAKGVRGAKGAKGARGATGPVGPPGPSVTKADILAAVDDQFGEIRKQLGIQLTRIAQLQMEIDKQHRETAELREQVEQVHALLKELAKASDLG